MFDIHEITAAPHLPAALKSVISQQRPEDLFALLAQAFEDNVSVEVKPKRR